MTLEDAARKFGEADWLVPHLCQWAELIRLPRDDDNTVERRLFAAAKYLEDWLPMYSKAADKVGVEYPICIDDVTLALHEELIPFLASEVDQPKDGPKPDRRRRLCAAVSLEVWRKLHGSVQPYSTKLWEACEAYWQACGHPETSTTSRLKNWEPFLVWASQRPPEHLVTTPKIV
jgi:hypothetical protein